MGHLRQHDADDLGREHKTSSRLTEVVAQLAGRHYDARPRSCARSVICEQTFRDRLLSERRGALVLVRIRWKRRHIAEWTIDLSADA